MAGPLVRLACARHLRDLDEGPKRGLRWDWPAARDGIVGYFKDVLRLNGGEHEGQPFELHPSQMFIVGSLFGWKGPDGLRRFRVAFVEEGKGNGKSPLAAGIGLYMLTADDEPRAEVYSAAVDKDQANILFRDAVAMVDQSPALDSRLTRSGSRGKEWNLAYLDRGSFFRPIASEHRGRGKSGPRVHCALLDEVHEHPTNAMVEFMRAGTKGRRQALILLITNSGFDRTTVCWHYHEYGEKIVKGLLRDDSFFAFICGLDEGDDWRDENVWPKANPLLGVSITRKYLREQVREAKGMPSKQNIVRRLNFCEWTESASAWIDKPTWDACQADIDPRSLRGRRCWGGLDLSGKRDLTSLSLAFEPGADGIWDALTWFWTPGDSIREREERDGVPYALWRDEKHLEATPGKVIDYAFVAKRMAAIAHDFDLQSVAFDSYRIDDLKAELDEINAEIALVEHPQGFRKAANSELWMPGSIDALEEVIYQVRIRIQINPVMNACAAAAVVVNDAQENKKFAKQKATGRIDGVVSLAMAVGLASAQPERGIDLNALILARGGLA